jgi:hypothetical protein
MESLGLAEQISYAALEDESCGALGGSGRGIEYIGIGIEYITVAPKKFWKHGSVPNPGLLLISYFSHWHSTCMHKRSMKGPFLASL